MGNILPPTTGVVLSTHLSFHNSAMIGTIDLKNAWKCSVEFFFLPSLIFLFCSSSLFCFFACSAGFSTFLLVMYAFCCIFCCFVYFPLSRLSYPIAAGSSMSRLYCSYPSYLLILIIASKTDYPLKYVMNPLCSMLHSLLSTLSFVLLICLAILFLCLLLLLHVKMWSSSSTVCQHDAHLLSWK